APTGAGLDTADPQMIRRAALQRSDRFRALIHAPAEAEDRTNEGASDGHAPTGAGPALVWFHVDEEHLTPTRPDEAALSEGGAIPVLADLADDAGERAKKQTCPSCRQDDGIRFLGSAIATMLPVPLFSLFDTPGPDEREKRALVRTDSVQDAAHRPRVAPARPHATTLRAVLR